jgi:simple sugar transport system ATP-binding protein
MSGITKRFPGIMANRDIDLQVPHGEIHGLLGENGAGKTTLMNIAYGLVQADAGSIEVDGSPVTIRSPRDAVALGIGMVHQHFMLVPDMTVAENVALGLRSSRLPTTNLRQVAEELDVLSRRHGLLVHPKAYVGSLSVGMRQRVEILKLLYRNARLLILDEPTSVLTPQEWKGLSGVLRSLASEGRSMVFITHKLDELMDVADRSTVLRDGAVVDTVEMATTDKATLARMMVGRDVVLRVPRVRVTPGEPVLAVQGLSLVDAEFGTLLTDVTFEVRAGEVLGIAGIDGNGQQELVEALLGLRERTRGQVRFRGRSLSHLNASPDIRNRVAVIPDDRIRFGVAADLTLQANLMMRDYRTPQFSRRGVLRPDAIRQHCQQLVRDFDVRVPHIRVRMRQLSGGNLQKAVVARELHRWPDLVIAAQPTRGLDVGAMEYVYGVLLEQKRRGAAIVLISTELDEILSLSDRIAVISRGRIPRILSVEEATAESLGLLMAGETVPAS